MAYAESGNSHKLREIVLNARRPLVLKDFKTNWKCTEGSLEDWCKLFDDAYNGAEFEQMQINSNTRHPQWERERKIVNMTMEQFLQQHKYGRQDYWTGLNYKTPNEMPKECKAGVDFSCFGFPHLTDDYARFWLSSTGANTPCHQDTYGVNIVVQVYGSKCWLLFPPNTNLTTTRLPYEESSVYCVENFYAPAPEQVNDLIRYKHDAYMCQLEAGDVLIVPRHWWHFVEATDISLSINAWIPLDVDAEAQLHECIVKYLIESMVRRESNDAQSYLLNPNQGDLSSEKEVLNILAFLCEKNNTTKDEKEAKNLEINYAYQYLEEDSIHNLLNEFPNANFVEKASFSEYEKFISQNAARFVNATENAEISPISNIKEALINSICCSSVVQQIAGEFKMRYCPKNELT